MYINVMKKKTGTYTVRLQLFECVLLDLLKTLTSDNMRNERISHIFYILNGKSRSSSQRRKIGLTAFDRKKCSHVYC